VRSSVTASWLCVIARSALAFLICSSTDSSASRFSSRLLWRSLSSYSTMRSFSLASDPTGAKSVTCTVPNRLGAVRVWVRTARNSPRE